MKREFIFEIKEIRSRRNTDMPNNEEKYVLITKGSVSIDGDDISVMVDDKSQPYGFFEAKDGLFKRIIKKIHNATK